MYPQIALLPVLAKLFEKCIIKRLNLVIEMNKLMPLSLSLSFDKVPHHELIIKISPLYLEQYYPLLKSNVKAKNPD